jgi:sugar phosphate isomerase/epimerase
MSAPPAIQVGFCWCFRDTLPEKGLPQLRESGFEGIELWPADLRLFGAQRWADALRGAGLGCFQLCPYFDFVHGPEKIAASRGELREFLDAARTLDCRRVRVFTGPPWGQGVVGAHDATEAQWRAATESLQEFCDAAAAQGVDLCLECHDGSLMEDSPSALRLLNAVQRRNLTANLQLPLKDPTWEVSVRTLGPYTSHIHIHNWTAGLGRGDLTFLGEGAFDWKPVLDHLIVKCQRTICLSVEHANHGGRHDPWETARRDGPWLRLLRKRYAAGPPRG